MKTLPKTVVALVSLLFLNDASADDSRRILFVTKNSGFVPPDRAYHVECDVYNDHTEMRIRKGVEPAVPDVQLRTTAYTPRVRDSRYALRLIQEATLGRIVLGTGRTDAPTASYIGILEGDVVERRVKLYEDLGVTRRKNSARGVDELIELADTNCPTPTF